MADPGGPGGGAGACNHKTSLSNLLQYQHVTCILKGFLLDNLKHNYNKIPQGSSCKYLKISVLSVPILTSYLRETDDLCQTQLLYNSSLSNIARQEHLFTVLDTTSVACKYLQKF